MKKPEWCICASESGQTNKGQRSLRFWSVHQKLTKKCEFNRIHCIHSIVYLVANTGPSSNARNYTTFKSEKKTRTNPCRWHIATSSSFSRKRWHLLANLAHNFFLSYFGCLFLLPRIACTLHKDAVQSLSGLQHSFSNFFIKFLLCNGAHPVPQYRLNSLKLK